LQGRHCGCCQSAVEFLVGPTDIARDLVQFASPTFPATPPPQARAVSRLIFTTAVPKREVRVRSRTCVERSRCWLLTERARDGGPVITRCRTARRVRPSEISACGQ